MVPTHEARSLGARLGPILWDMVAKQIDEAKREARPDRPRKVERHPGYLLPPMSEVVRHDPTRGRIMQTLQRAQSSAAIREPVLPPAQVHRYVDGDEKGQVARDPDDCDQEGQPDQSLE